MGFGFLTLTLLWQVRSCTLPSGVVETSGSDLSDGVENVPVPWRNSTGATVRVRVAAHGGSSIRLRTRNPRLREQHTRLAH